MLFYHCGFSWSTIPALHLNMMCCTKENESQLMYSLSAEFHYFVGVVPFCSVMGTGREIKATKTCGHLETGLGAPLMWGCTYISSFLLAGWLHMHLNGYMHRQGLSLSVSVCVCVPPLNSYEVSPQVYTILLCAYPTMTCALSVVTPNYENSKIPLLLLVERFYSWSGGDSKVLPNMVMF